MEWGGICNTCMHVFPPHPPLTDACLMHRHRVLTVVTSELLPPYPDRPTEGFLALNVEYSPMAALGIDVRACLSACPPRPRGTHHLLPFPPNQPRTHPSIHGHASIHRTPARPPHWWRWTGSSSAASARAAPWTWRRSASWRGKRRVLRVQKGEKQLTPRCCFSFHPTDLLPPLPPPRKPSPLPWCRCGASGATCGCWTTGATWWTPPPSPRSVRVFDNRLTDWSVGR